MAIQINGDSGISGVNGSAGTPALQGTDSNTGIVFGTDTVQISTGGSTRVTVDSSGSSTFSSTLTSKPSSAAYAYQVNIGSTNYGGLYRDTSSSRLILGDGSTTKVDLKGSDGSATFAGGNFNLYSNGSFEQNSGASFGGNVLIKNGSTTKTSLINDGTATFGGAVTINQIQSIGTAFQVNNLNAAAGVNPTVLITATGNATFNGNVTSKSTFLNELQSGYSSSDSAFKVFAGGSTFVDIKAGGNATFAGNVTAANVSDIRFKENITDANPQLADAVALGSQLKNWDWNDDAPLNEELRAKRFLGLVAQEAEKVCPGLTYTVPRTKQGKELTAAVLDEDGNETKAATYEELDDSFKAINHDILVMKLLGAVAELSTKVAALESRVTTPEAG